MSDKRFVCKIGRHKFEDLRFKELKIFVLVGSIFPVLGWLGNVNIVMI